MDLPGLISWLQAAPEGTSVPASTLAEFLSRLPSHAPLDELTAKDAAPITWRERIWTVPAETRLGVLEMAEAIGRPRSWVYRHTSEKASGSGRLPCRKLDGELVFVVGEIRNWLRDHEEVITAGRPESPTLALASRRAS